MSTHQAHADRDMSIQAATFLGAGQPLVVREFPRPQLQAHEALVRINCCTICGSDLHTITGARIERTPSILGHEIVGEIIETSDPPLRDIDGQPLVPGDRVTWSTSVSCGTCDRCQRGMPQKCRSLSKYGHELAEGRAALSGGLAEGILLRSGSTVVMLDREIADEVICPVNCATATVAAAYRSAGRIDRQRILIFGAGMLGITAAAFAKSNGAAQTVVCDPDASRLERAGRFGADVLVEWSADEEGFRQRVLKESGNDVFDVILELSGSPDAVEAAVRVGDVGAQIILVGTVMKSRSVSLDPEHLVRRWLSVHGVHNYAPEDLQTAVSFLNEFGNVFPFAELVEHTFPLAEVNQAIETAIRKRPVRVAIRP